MVRIIKINFYSQDVPYDVYCNVTTMLKIDWVYKKSEKSHLQLYAEKCKCTGSENKRCCVLSDSDGMDILKC